MVATMNSFSLALGADALAIALMVLGITWLTGNGQTGRE
jgi:hypothetical protein